MPYRKNEARNSEYDRVCSPRNRLRLDGWPTIIILGVLKTVRPRLVFRKPIAVGNCNRFVSKIATKSTHCGGRRTRATVRNSRRPHAVVRTCIRYTGSNVGPCRRARCVTHGNAVVFFPFDTRVNAAVPCRSAVLRRPFHRRRRLASSLRDSGVCRDRKRGRRKEAVLHTFRKYE